MERITLTPIGKVQSTQEGFSIKLDEAFIPALRGLEGFGHIQVLWWCSQLDTPQARTVLEVEKPYKAGPEKLGIFATRSPVRPNPIALTAVQVLGINHEAGVIHLPYIDAFDGTPVLDLKPYTPSSDRVKDATVPAWCEHWPKNLEDSEEFDWENEFNF